MGVMRALHILAKMLNGKGDVRPCVSEKVELSNKAAITSDIRKGTTHIRL